MVPTTPPAPVSNTDPSPAPEAPAQAQGEVNAWRKLRFVELGFDDEAAELLVVALDYGSAKTRNGEVRRYSFPLHADRVKKLLDAGKTHHQVIELYVFV
jgi:hypothetical protein